MTLRQHDVFQGNDWLTYRWPVAQAFDTLDRIRYLCALVAAGGDRLPMEVELVLPFDVGHHGAFDIFGTVVELCEDLFSTLEAVQADLMPYLQNEPTHRWAAFEMQLHLKEMRRQALEEYQDPGAPDVTADKINALTGRIRDLLKQIDQ